MGKSDTPEQRFDEAFQVSDEARERLLAFLDRVTQGESERRPGRKEWSIGEIAHHLILVEKRYREYMLETIRARREGQFEEKAVLSKRTFPLQHAADVTKSGKGKAPQPVEPSHGMSIGEMREQLRQIRAETKSQLLPYRTQDLGDFWYEHPRLGPMTLYERTRLIGYHELKHLAQMERLTAAP